MGQGTDSPRLRSPQPFGRTEEALIFRTGCRSKTGKADYYIDNIYIDWSVGEPPYYYTAEKKRDTLTKALDAYLAGVMKAAGGYIRSWDVLDEPMSDDGRYHA